MEQLAPLGPVYQAGTLPGNPVATACGLATLKEVCKPGFYEALGAKTQSLMSGLKGAADKAGVHFSVEGIRHFKRHILSFPAANFST